MRRWTVLAAVVTVVVGLGLASPSGAVPCDLTLGGQTCTFNGAIYSNLELSPAGSGVISSFVRINPGGSQTTEQGYNTDGRPVQFDENTSATFTRSLLLSNVPTVLQGGVLYRQFRLDINETNSTPLLTLDQVRIFLEPSGALTNCATVGSSACGTLNGLPPIYSLDTAAADNWVQLNFNLASGSGMFDMFLLVPDALFAGAGANQFVYLFSQFGCSPTSATCVDSGSTTLKFTADDGFEEWAVSLPTAAVPEPATLLLMGTGLVGTGMARRFLSRRRSGK